MALARMLTRVGYDAAVVPCGRDLIERLESGSRPRLVILDLMMPEMDGFDCLRLMRAHPDWKDIPVVMYSADFNYDRAREAARLGAQDYIVKGAVRWDDFLDIVARRAAPPPSSTTPDC